MDHSEHIWYLFFKACRIPIDFNSEHKYFIIELCQRRIAVKIARITNTCQEVIHKLKSIPEVVNMDIFVLDKKVDSALIKGRYFDQIKTCGYYFGRDYASRLGLWVEVEYLYLGLDIIKLLFEKCKKNEALDIYNIIDNHPHEVLFGFIYNYKSGLNLMEITKNTEIFNPRDMNLFYTAAFYADKLCCGPINTIKVGELPVMTVITYDYETNKFYGKYGLNSYYVDLVFNTEIEVKNYIYKKLLKFNKFTLQTNLNRDISKPNIVLGTKDLNLQIREEQEITHGLNLMESHLKSLKETIIEKQITLDDSTSKSNLIKFNKTCKTTYVNFNK